MAAVTLMDTSATCVAGPIPQPSSLPIRFRGEVGGLCSGMRGLLLAAVPPKMPPPVPGGVPGCPPGVGSLTPGGCGGRTATEEAAADVWSTWRASGSRCCGAASRGHGRRFKQEHLIELSTSVGELGAQAAPRGVLVFAGIGLQPFHLPQVDNDLPASAQAKNALLHRRFTKPRDAVLARRPWFLQFTQQLAHCRVFGGGFEH